MTQQLQYSVYRTGESSYEKNEKKEVARVSSMGEFQKLQEKFTKARKQFPEGEGNAIFSRLFDEVSSKMEDYKKDMQKIQKHTQKKHIVAKTSTEQQKLKNEIVQPGPIQFPDLPSSAKQTGEPKGNVEKPEIKDGFFHGAKDGANDLFQFLKK